MGKRDAFQEITDKLIAKIEGGAATWEMPWLNMGGMPVNASTNRMYTGVNALNLWASGREQQHWATYKQWVKLGAQVRKGERGEVILVPIAGKKTVENDAGDEEHMHFTYFRAAAVFNATQVDGYECPTVDKADETELVAELERIVDGSDVKIVHGSNAASYNPTLDEVHMPSRKAFVATGSTTATESYYGTLIHELVHATGHKSRLGRELTARFGSESYAMEELIAELGSAFVANQTGLILTPTSNNVAYVQSWLKVLRNDKRAIQVAASQATKAAAWLIEGSEA